MFDIAKYEMQLVTEGEEYKEKRMSEISEAIDTDVEFWAEKYAKKIDEEGRLFGSARDAHIAKAVKDEKAKRLAEAEAELDKEIENSISEKLAKAETEE